MENSNQSEEYDQISKRLFKVEVTTLGTSNIWTNFTQMKSFNWDILNLPLIQQYPTIYHNLVNQINNQFSNSLSIIGKLCPIESLHMVIASYLPETYQLIKFIKNEIIHRWLACYQSDLNGIYQEDKFDIVWYEAGSSDWRWAVDRLKNIELITREIRDYSEIFLQADVK